MIHIALAIQKFCTVSKEEFNRIDGLQGDGDLGITVELIGSCIVQAAGAAANLKEWLKFSGTAVRKQAPSTMGILVSFALLAAARSLQEEEDYTAQTYADLQRTMIDEIKKRGEAEAGDRTVLDAFIPAYDAYAKAVQEGSTGLEALRAAVKAAEQGTEQTRQMPPKTGRASWVGSRVVGEVDGGARLCHQIYQVIYQALCSEENSDS